MFGALGAIGGAGGAVAPWALAPDVSTDIDFVADRGFTGSSPIGSSSSFFTFTRASPAYAEDSAGNYSLFNNNILRRTDKGALIECGRTNGIRNNSMQGIALSTARAAGGAINTITRTASATVVVATASAHNLQVNDLVTVSGCAVATYNGTFPVVTTADATHFTYLTTTSATDAGGGTPVYSGISPGTPPTNWTLGVVSGLGTAVLATGTIQGLDYMDVRYSGVSTTTSFYGCSLENNSSIAAVQNDIFATSIFYQILATGAGSASIAGFSWSADNVEYPGGNDRTGVFSAQPSATLTRVFAAIQVVNVAAANIQPRTNVGSVTNNTYYDFTIRYASPQCEKCSAGAGLEVGQQMTSPMRTTGSAAARSMDVCPLTATPALNTAVGCTLYCEVMIPVKSTGIGSLGFPRLLVANGSNADNDSFGFGMRDTAAANTTSFAMCIGGAGQSLSADPTSTIVVGTPFKIAGRFKDGSHNVSIQGNIGTANAGIPAFTAPIVAVGLSLHSFFQNPSVLWFRRIGIWNTISFSDSRLQGQTT